MFSELQLGVTDRGVNIRENKGESSLAREKKPIVYVNEVSDRRAPLNFIVFENQLREPEFTYPWHSSKEVRIRFELTWKL